MNQVSDSTKEIAGIAATGDATEFSCRTTIENMLQVAEKAG